MCIRDSEKPITVTISVPDGRELAEKTFNPKLGIIGGISILGTSGILEPMSEQAIIDTIETEIKQMSFFGKKSLLVTPGNYGISYAQEYLGLDTDGAVKCSNYICLLYTSTSYLFSRIRTKTSCFGTEYSNRYSGMYWNNTSCNNTYAYQRKSVKGAGYCYACGIRGVFICNIVICEFVLNCLIQLGTFLII